MKKFAVLLSGCGVFDGAEIHEATLTLLAIKRQNSDYQIFAPDIEQHHVINHLTGDVMHEKRNVLVESARIARGKIKPLTEYHATEFDGLILPGGFGVAKNLSSYAFDGADCTVLEDVSRAIIETHKAGKPIGALCIAPVLIAKILKNVDITIGQDEKTIKSVEAMGAKHISTHPTDIIVDKSSKVVTSPCYMLDSSIAQIFEGAENVVKAMMEMK